MEPVGPGECVLDSHLVHCRIERASAEIIRIERFASLSCEDVVLCLRVEGLAANLDKILRCFPSPAKSAMRRGRYFSVNETGKPNGA